MRGAADFTPLVMAEEDVRSIEPCAHRSFDFPLTVPVYRAGAPGADPILIGFMVWSPYLVARVAEAGAIHGAQYADELANTLFSALPTLPPGSFHLSDAPWAFPVLGPEDSVRHRHIRYVVWPASLAAQVAKARRLFGDDGARKVFDALFAAQPLLEFDAACMLVAVSNGPDRE